MEVEGDMTPRGGEESADCAQCGAMGNSRSRWRWPVLSISQRSVVDMMLPHKSPSTRPQLQWLKTSLVLLLHTLLQILTYMQHQHQ